MSGAITHILTTLQSRGEPKMSQHETLLDCSNLYLLAFSSVYAGSTDDSVFVFCVSLNVSTLGIQSFTYFYIKSRKAFSSVLA